MSGPLIIIPQPMPPGRRMQQGERTSYPTCDRCRRESSERNPVLLSSRESWDNRERHRDSGGVMKRRDAICAECRELLKRRH